MAPDKSRSGTGDEPDEDKTVYLPKEDRIPLYAAARYLGLETERKLRLRIPFAVYFKDPSLANNVPGNVLDELFLVRWEPGLSDGPTSARFAVVDFDATTNTLERPSVWNDDEEVFYSPDKVKLDAHAQETRHFRQVSTWALVQNALDFFESRWGLGRPISWGFEGNRLIIVPHAGYGKNAYYDRKSKSLQFYYFNDEEDEDNGKTIYTCLSSDIVNHEFGHAVLDGIRPYFLESIFPQTGAFHEFMGDLSAVLIAFRNNSFREIILKATGGKLEDANILANIASQFGQAVKNRPYLRTALNKLSMGDLATSLEPHDLSQVMTGAMFDIIIGISQRYLARQGKFDKRTLWQTIQRMQVMAVQPLDLLPPIDASFADYARAVLRAEQIANPTDPQGYRPMMIDIFIARGILSKEDGDELRKPKTLFERLQLDVFHEVARFAGSPAAAYRFLDDNRRKLFIPRRADIIVPEVFVAEKYTRDGQQQPAQILLQYVWREDVLLEGERFGRFEGQATSLLCGGTLAFNENGNLLHWVRKPGSESFDGRAPRRNSKWVGEIRTGEERRSAFLDMLARRIAAGMIGDSLGTGLGLLERSIRPLTSGMVDGALRFELNPHLSLDHEHEELGGRQWTISS